MEAKELAEKVCEILESHKGEDVRVIDLRGKTEVADFFVIVFFLFFNDFNLLHHTRFTQIVKLGQIKGCIIHKTFIFQQLTHIGEPAVAVIN